MWKLATNTLSYRFRPYVLAWIGMGTLSTVAAIVSNSNDKQNRTLAGVTHSLSSIQILSNTLCEPFAVQHKMSHLRRHSTIQKMEKTATLTSLQELYKVDWKNTLGEGNFGSVHTAIDRRTGETVAVKKMSKKVTDNVTFQREMDALLHIRQSGGHPNICGLRENFDDGNYYYLVLDYVCGGEMFDHLCKQGAYSEADAARLIREAASALAYLHGINIVHGDVKPENLMLSTKHASDAVIKVVDFGCAQVTHGDDLSQGISSETLFLNVGVARTPAYCPPEILKTMCLKDGRRVEPSFDMWALGVILYIMLTGVHPFDLFGEASDEDIANQILSRTLPPLRNSSLTAHLSDDAIALIEQLLQWDPGKRLTAYQVLNNPWVRGVTARTDKMENSDTRLSKYKAFKSKLAAKVFADMVSLSSNEEKIKKVDCRESLLERAFHTLDESHKGYVTTKDLQKLTNSSPGLANVNTTSSEDEQLSLSGFAGLMEETLKNRYYPKGHIIYNEGDKGDAMFFLNSGAIEISTKDGFKKVVKKPGDFFGEGALISHNGLRSASIRCLTPVHVIEVGRDYFEKFLNADYDLKLYLREMNIKRQRERANAMLEMQQCLSDRTVHRNEFVFTEKDTVGELYLLDEGSVDIIMNGRKVTSVSRHGDIFGEHSLIVGYSPRNVSAQCKSEKCKLHVLTARDFYSVVDSHPTMKNSLRNLFNRREFQKAVCLITGNSFPENEKDLRRAFDTIGKNHSGKLELENIRSAIKQLDPAYTEEDVVAILASLDLDESGEVSWPEFKRLFGMDAGSS